MLIPSGIIIMWPGTNASIPAGWTRVTSLDSKHPKGTGAGVDPNVTGGADTHAHIDPGHTHSISAHTHDGQTTGVATSVAIFNSVDVSVADTHTHTTGTSGSAGSSSSSTAGGWQSASNDPSFLGVIYIQSDGTPTGFPSGGWAFWDKVASLPINWSNPASARNVFPKGAGAGGDGGGTGGGSHTHTANSHTHIFNADSHTGGTTSTHTAANSDGSNTSQTFNIAATHDHTWSLAAGSTQENAQTSASPGSTSYEPAWTKLVIVQNDSGGQDIQARHVAGWLGVLSSIPAGWVLCDGTNGTVDMRGRFVKGANSISEIGNTGGTAGHSHSDPTSHTHAYDHTHALTIGAGSASSFLGRNDTTSVTAASDTHVHAGTSTSATGTSGTGVQTAPSTADTQPAFRTVAFVALTADIIITAAINVPVTIIAPSVIFAPPPLALTGTYRPIIAKEAGGE